MIYICSVSGKNFVLIWFVLRNNFELLFLCALAEPSVGWGRNGPLKNFIKPDVVWEHFRHFLYVFQFFFYSSFFHMMWAEVKFSNSTPAFVFEISTGDIPKPACLIEQTATIGLILFRFRLGLRLDFQTCTIFWFRFDLQVPEFDRSIEVIYHISARNIWYTTYSWVQIQGSHGLCPSEATPRPAPF